MRAISRRGKGSDGNLMSNRYFDDFRIGEIFVSAGITLSRAQIIDFALTYDPQPIHLDATQATEGPYGGLIASGFQTMALGFRLFYQLGVINHACVGGPSIDAIRFHQPARPDDTIHVKATIQKTRLSRSKPDRGYISIAYEVLNQHDELILTYEIVHIMIRRPTTA